MPAETHVERSPIGPDDVFRIIRERLAEILEIDEDRITLDSDFADDLDADSLALIELVEALEEELGERTVGFTHRRRRPRRPEDGPRRGRLRHAPAGHGDASLEPLGAAVPRPGTRCTTAARARAGRSSTTRCSTARSRTARTAPSRASRRRTSGSSSSATPCSGSSSPHFVFERVPAAARRRARQAARLGRERGDARRGRAQELDLGAASAPRQGRGRVRRARQAVDPRRRDGGGDRRRLPRRRARDRRASSCCAAREPRSASRPPVPAGGDYKTRLQELAAAALRPAPALPGAPRGPRPLQALLRRRAASAARRTATGEGRSKKAAEQAAARVAWERVAGRGDDAAHDGASIGGGDA